MNTSMYTVLALYKFTKLNNLEHLQSTLRYCATELAILGTLILAPEGINGTIAGTQSAIHQMMQKIRLASQALADLEGKYSIAHTQPFQKLKILIKKEIVTLGIQNLDPEKKTGILVEGPEWNQLLLDPDVLVIDTRNIYEVKAGTFKNAQNPQTNTFREFPHYVNTCLETSRHKKIAMFCTGGIRCEKASSFLLNQGFENVYQLKGGILKYLETMEPEHSLWEGECFIFDSRGTVSRENTLLPVCST